MINDKGPSMHEDSIGEQKMQVLDKKINEIRNTIEINEYVLELDKASLKNLEKKLEELKSPSSDYFSKKNIGPQKYYREEIKDMIKICLEANFKKKLLISEILELLHIKYQCNPTTNTIKTSVLELISSGEMKCVNPNKIRGKRYTLLKNQNN